MKRHASAVWKGGLKDGQGTLTTERGALKDVAYNFSGRFESGTTGTNPEELVGAALAGCFAMALSGDLEKAGTKAERVDAKADVALEKKEKWTVVGIHLDVRAKVPGMDKDTFQKVAEGTKAGCPISRLLSPGVPITMSARLE